MRDPFLRSHSSSQAWILDGGFATELERQGKDLSAVCLCKYATEMPAGLHSTIQAEGNFFCYRIIFGALNFFRTTLKPSRQLT
jgi:hypothetical protein